MSLDPSQVSRRLPALVALFIALGAAGPRSSGQAPDRSATKEDGRAERLAEMKQIAGSFQAVAIAGADRTRVPLARDPLYRWTDPTRANNDGSLWIWRSSGRPIAVLAVELYPQDKAFGPVWALEFTSLSTGPIEVEGGEHFDRVYSDLSPPRAGSTLRWAPVKGGIGFREIHQETAISHPTAHLPVGVSQSEVRTLAVPQPSSSWGNPSENNRSDRTWTRWLPVRPDHLIRKELGPPATIMKEVYDPAARGGSGAGYF